MTYFQHRFRKHLRKSYIVFYIFLIFCSSRGYYFFLSDYQLASALYDSTWWLSLENILNNPLLENDEYYKIRIETRFPLEIILHKLICVVANASHFSRVRINLYITSIIYILFIYISFYLGKKELKSPSLGLLYSFCCIQTVYSVWLSFPIFTPKIIGFTLYPLALYALTTHEEKVNYYYVFLLILWATFYPISLIYCLPSIVVGTGLYYYIFKDECRKLNFQIFLITLVILMMSVTISFLIIKSYPATSLEFFSLFYSTYSNSLSLILKNYYFYFAYIFIFSLCVISDFFFKIIKNKIVYLYIFITITSIVGSLVCYILQNYISFFRTSWFWRSVFYSNIPAIMAILLFFKEILSYLSSKKMAKNYIYFLPLTIFISMSFIHNPDLGSSLNIFNISIKVKRIIWQKSKQNESEIDFFKITEILKKMDRNDHLLLPPLNLQSNFTDTVEAYIPLKCLLSRGDSYHFIFQTDLTNDYIKKISKYNHIFREFSNISNELSVFMRELKVNFVLLPRRIDITSPLFQPLYLGSEWALYMR